MSLPWECPKCKESFKGKPIPEELHDSYCEPHFFNTVIGLEDPSKYDGVLWWECPFCRHTWKRFEGMDYNE